MEGLSQEFMLRQLFVWGGLYFPKKLVRMEKTGEILPVFPSKSWELLGNWATVEWLLGALAAYSPPYRPITAAILTYYKD